MKLRGIFLLVLAMTSYAMSDHQTTQDHSITIFVHGTYIMRKLLQYSPCRPFMYCPQGLTLAKHLPAHYHFYKIAHGCVASDNKSYSVDQFYVFGWESEYVNDANRNKSAKILVEQMYEVVVDYYIRHNVIPKIRLIGYSHGGNVILHTAHYLPQYADMQDVEIEAWLFGTPVQVVSHDLVNSDCFSAIYSLYSQKDIIQKIDPQGLINRKLTKNHFWSDRTFCPYSKCVQVDFTVNGYAINHADYNLVFKHFPKIKKLVEEQSVHLDYGGMIAVNFKETLDSNHYKGLPKE
jgi:predicted esterase